MESEVLFSTFRSKCSTRSYATKCSVASSETIVMAVPFGYRTIHSNVVSCRICAAFVMHIRTQKPLLFYTAPCMLSGSGRSSLCETRELFVSWWRCISCARERGRVLVMLHAQCAQHALNWRRRDERNPKHAQLRARHVDPPPRSAREAIERNKQSHKSHNKLHVWFDFSFRRIPPFPSFDRQTHTFNKVWIDRAIQLHRLGLKRNSDFDGSLLSGSAAYTATRASGRCVVFGVRIACTANFDEPMAWTRCRRAARGRPQKREITRCQCNKYKNKRRTKRANGRVYCGNTPMAYYCWCLWFSYAQIVNFDRTPSRTCARRRHLELMALCDAHTFRYCCFCSVGHGL